MTASDEVVVIGRVIGVHGVRGWIKVYSYTRVPQEIEFYRRWFLKGAGDWDEYRVAELRAQGKGIVARLNGIDDRDVAAGLVGRDIGIRASELPPLPPGEYYWSQLEGLSVVNRQGIDLGRVSHLFDTGANDVMVVVGARERLIPYIGNVVHRVDPQAGVIEVDWDADF